MAGYDGTKLENEVEVTTWTTTDWMDITNTSAGSTNKIAPQNILAGNETGVLTLKNPSPGDGISFGGVNTSLVTVAPFKLGTDTNSLDVDNFLRIGRSAITISAGVIVPIRSHHGINTEAAAASDDVDTIDATGIGTGTILFLKAQDTTKTVVIKHMTGNISLVGGVDFSLDDSEKMCMLIWNGALWREPGR